ncbi:MAG: hypothetical protein KF857_06505 [Fimbriimonadaceae bacterium]|nr:hypothetical protein [Fimbriimonadaceae bacterium]
MQYLDTGWFGVLITLLMVAFVLLNIARAKGKKELFIRRIAGLNALDDAIGRATEMGRPILMVPGIGALNAISVQAINIFKQVAKTAAQFGTPIRICCADAAVYTVAQELIRDVYQEQGMIERFDAQTVQFISDRQFAFAAGVSGMVLRDQAAASFLLGEFYAESLIFAETANAIGAIQIAGSTKTAQTPFFIAACDYVLIGDEYYAASAYLTREPVLVGSLIGQDWGKILIALLVTVGFLFNSIERVQPATQHRDEDDKGNAVWNQVDPATVKENDKLKKASDTFMYQVFNPFITEDMKKVERQKDPNAPVEEGK